MAAIALRIATVHHLQRLQSLSQIQQFLFFGFHSQFAFLPRLPQLPLQGQGHTHKPILVNIWGSYKQAIGLMVVHFVKLNI